MLKTCVLFNVFAETVIQNKPYSKNKNLTDPKLLNTGNSRWCM